MRQYQIIYHRLGGKAAKLEPHVHAGLYDRPEVQAAVEHLRVNPHIDGLAMLLDGNRFNIMVFDQEAEAPNSFQFAEPDIKAVLREQLVKLHDLSEQRLDQCEANGDIRDSDLADLSALLLAINGTVEGLIEAEGGE
jgi:hypothetical protein